MGLTSFILAMPCYNTAVQSCVPVAAYMTSVTVGSDGSDPLPSSRHHLSYDDRLEDKMENYQK